MKKTITIVILGLAVIACHRKTLPPKENVSTTIQTPTKLESTNVDAVHAELVAKGKTVYTDNCGKCHGLKTVDNYTTDRWTNILKSMIPKAKLNELQSQQVTAYVMENAKK